MAASAYSVQRQPQVVPVGQTGNTGPVGPGVPIGGAAGTHLVKSTATDFDTSWQTTATLGADAGLLTSLETTFDSRYAPISLGRVAAPLTINADQTGISGVTDYTGFSITFTVVTGRFYEVQWHFLSSQVTSTGTQTHSVVLDGTGIIIGNVTLAAGATNVNSGAMQFCSGAASGNVPVVATGSRVIKLRGLTSAGTMNLANAGAMNGRFSVKDIGPNP